MISFSDHSQFLDHTLRPDDNITQEITKIMDQGRQLAESTISNNKAVLIKLGQYLADHSRINRKKFITLMKTWDVRTNDSLPRYRDMLFLEVAEPANKLIDGSKIASQPLQLNRTDFDNLAPIEDD
jgi:hypothetical protein